MRTLYLIALFLILVTSPVFAASGDVQVAGDPSPWHITSDDQVGGVRTVELLRPGHNFGSSPELMVIVKMRGDDASEAAEDYLSAKKSECDDGHYEFLRSGWEDTSYRWEPRGCDLPETDLDEVGRFVVLDGGGIGRVSIFLRRHSALSFWESWISGRYGTYSSWSSSVFGGKAPSGKRPQTADVEAPDSDICDDDDLDCLLRVQRQQVAALDQNTRELEDLTREDSRGGGRRGGSASGGSRSHAGSDDSGGGGNRGGGTGCCFVRQVKSLHLQTEHPNSGRSDDFTFRSTDTYIYAVLDLSGARGGSTVTFRWVKFDHDGDEKSVLSRDVDIEGGSTWVYGSLYFTGLTPTGDYRVYVYYDGTLAGTHDFEVVAGSSFG